jgi:hypothetical protein
MIIEQIASVCHEANRMYCTNIGDTSQLPWEEASDWQRLSAINGVKFKLKNPNSTPEQQHESWLKEKYQNGWKYGLIKDETKKEHPCCVPYTELPMEQRKKDYLFCAIVEVLK